MFWKPNEKTFPIQALCAPGTMKVALQLDATHWVHTLKYTPQNYFGNLDPLSPCLQSSAFSIPPPSSWTSYLSWLPPPHYSNIYKEKFKSSVRGKR